MNIGPDTKPLASLVVASVLPFALTASIAVADQLASPSSNVILTVSGAITATNDGDTAVFDLEMLKAMPSDEFVTSTIWTEDSSTYTGVPLHTFLEAIGAEGETLVATAINDYSVEVPTSDAVEDGPIIAYLSDGQEMSRRDKGPLWIIYPYDDNINYRTEVIYSRSIWQLDRLTVE